MTEARRCGTCGAELSAEASPQGLCARCLLEAGLKSTGAGVDSRQETSAAAAGQGPIEVAELSRLFPQLDIQRLLGRGGMGAVYLARQKALDRPVALKLLAPKGGTDPEFAERFAREAKALARLNHPGIVAVHDFGAVEGLYYFLMEYVEGTSLREVMRKGKLAPRQALALVPQICDALQYAHDEGVVHRDIKPENVLLDKKGRIKVADFGLAKILGQDASGDALTGSRHVMGTPHYMAPEQLEHPREVDHRADIYSLGVVFYEMLTGELPLGRFAPPSRKVQVDVRLDEVVLRALEKEPERRYQHASELKSDIGEIRPTEANAVPPTVQEEVATKSWLPRWWLVMIALAAGAYAFAFFVSTGDPVNVFMGLCFVDFFFSSWFRCQAPAGSLVGRQKLPKPVHVALVLTVMIIFAIMHFKTSSFIWSGLIAGSLLGLVVYGGVRALSAKNPEERTGGLLPLQTAGMLLLVHPTFKPMDYLSWAYRLSGTKPKPDDALVFGALFGAALAALLAWKIQTWRALSRRRAAGRLTGRAA